MKNKFIIFLTISGALVVLFSLLFDASGFGKSGIDPAQLLVIDLGVMLAILGVGLTLGKRETTPTSVQVNWLDRISSMPNIIWIVVGAFIVYLIFLVRPVFFNSDHMMVYFNRYVPSRNHIGLDFEATLTAIETWFADGTSEIYYPPLVNVLFAPLLLAAYPINYYIITAITLVSYFMVGFVLPFLIVEGKDRSVVSFIFGISIFSYGLQFELERGQFHTIAMFFCILAVYLFHKQPKYRFFAYLLFCISVQFKIYPALFFVMFVDDWQDWANNIKRFAILGLVNFLLLFLLGYSYFSRFITHIKTSSAASVEMWNGNHSIISFLNYILTPKAGLLDESSMAWVGKNINLLGSLFILYFAISFIIVLGNAYRRNVRDIDPLLLMVCMIGGLIIPSINHDYTLPLLTAPFALIASEQYIRDILQKRIAVIVLLVISSSAYALTLLPFIHKPLLLKNSFPLLMILLTATTLLSFLRKREVWKSV